MIRYFYLYYKKGYKFLNAAVYLFLLFMQHHWVMIANFLPQIEKYRTTTSTHMQRFTKFMFMVQVWNLLIASSLRGGGGWKSYNFYHSSLGVHAKESRFTYWSIKILSFIQFYTIAKWNTIFLFRKLLCIKLMQLQPCNSPKR